MHTDCGLFGLDDEAEAASILRETGVAAPFSLGGFTDLARRVSESVEIARNSPLLPHREDVHGYIYDVETLRLAEVRIG